ncbi:hypothetical protein N8700_03720 [Candidatus Pelagibacter sp.]|nr:hypothetical protein [Candidatus Pelagibacter sp.]
MAEIKTPGSGMIENSKLEESYTKQLKKAQKKKKNLIYYLSVGNEGSWGDGTSFSKEINDAAHEKAYKKCMKNAKKSTQNDCFLFAINDKIVWDFTKINPLQKEKETVALSYTEQDQLKYSNPEDDKLGRSLADRPDASDDFQVHIIYSLASDSKDNEMDINGELDKIVKDVNDGIYEITKKASKSGIGQKFKFDMTKDGKLDVTFVRFNCSEKNMKRKTGGDWSGKCKLSKYNYWSNFLKLNGFNNPKKIYVNFSDINSNTYAFSAGYPYVNIWKKVKGKKVEKKRMPTLFLHEIAHSMGAVFKCSPNVENGHIKGENNDLMNSNSNNVLDKKNDDYYDHEMTDCPDLIDSVYFTPTSDTPYDPFELACLKRDDWKLTNKIFKYEGNTCFLSDDYVLGPPKWLKNARKRDLDEY